jgi:fatty acid desaturase
MTTVIEAFVSRHKHGLEWLHIGLVVGSLCVVCPVVAWSGGLVFSPWRALLIFALATIAWCQNIGLVHHYAHHLPPGPRWLGLWTARALHYLGGLPYTQTRLAHRLHHAHLGTPLDPDRLGYESTATAGGRFRYLFYIGPLRTRFAPVDMTAAIRAMSPQQYAAHEQRCRRDRRLVIVAQLLLIPISGLYYPFVASALLVANVLSNVREMAEHGRAGSGAYVDIRVSPLGVLLFSTPGFWLHGVHHMNATVHYLDLPLARGTLVPKTNLPYLSRDSAVTHLFTGR